MTAINIVDFISRRLKGNMESNMDDNTGSLVCDLDESVVVGVGGGTAGDAKVRCDDGDVNKFAAGGIERENERELEEWLGQMNLNEKFGDSGVVMASNTSGWMNMEPDNTVAHDCSCNNCRCEILHVPAVASSQCAAVTTHDLGHQKDELVEFTPTVDTMVVLETPKSTRGPIQEWVENARKAAGMAPGTPRRPTKGELLDFFAHNHCKCGGAMYLELEGWCSYCTSGLRRRVRDELWEMTNAWVAKRDNSGVRKTLFVDGVEADEPWPEPMA